MALEVTHPGAAQLLDSGDDEGQLFIVFEYVAGDDLSTVLDQQGALPFADAIEIALKVASVLDFAHGRGVVHRDIKPENIRLRRDLVGWHVKVLDFGIARLMDDVGTQLTAEGSVAGTPRYMAPEQISANAVDARTDIYSLGLVLFEMVSGREAFARESTPQLMWAQMHTPVPPLREIQPERDFSDLDAVIAMATAKQPEARFSTAAAFINALKSLDAPRWPPAVPIKRRRSVSGGMGFNSGSDSPTPALPLMTDVPIVQASRPNAPPTVSPTAASTAASPAAPMPLHAAPTPTSSHQSGVRKTPLNKTVLIAGIGGTVLLALGLIAALWTTISDNLKTAHPANPQTERTPLPASRTVAANKLEAASSPAASTTPPSCAATASVQQLEERARQLRHPMPSVVAGTLNNLKAASLTYPAAAQDCQYRSSIAALIDSETAAVKNTPALWGHTRDLSELKNWLRTQPLKTDWDEDQRNAVLAQMESDYITPLRSSPSDADYWRRSYLGLIFACELSDEALKLLDARRPMRAECLVLTRD